MHTTDAKVKIIIGNDIAKETKELIMSANHKIYIVMYEWKFYPHEKGGGVQELYYSIIQKKREKKDVKVILNIESMGHAITRINSLTASELQKRGIEVKFGQIGTATHAKFIIVDEAKAVIGSHNWTKGAFTRNHEVSVLIEGAEAVRPAVDYFKLLWGRL